MFQAWKQQGPSLRCSHSAANKRNPKRKAKLWSPNVILRQSAFKTLDRGPTEEAAQAGVAVFKAFHRCRASLRSPETPYTLSHAGASTSACAGGTFLTIAQT